MDHDTRVRIHGTVLRGPERFPGRLELGLRPLDPRARRHRAHPHGRLVGRRDGDAVTHSRRVFLEEHGDQQRRAAGAPPRRWTVRETTSLSAGASSHSVQPYQARTWRPSTVVCVATGRGMTSRTRRGHAARWLPPATSWWWPAPSWPASHQARQTDWILRVSTRPACTTRRAQRPHAPAASATRPAVATRTEAVDRRLDHASETRRGAGRGPQARADVRIRRTDRRRRNRAPACRARRSVEAEPRHVAGVARTHDRRRGRVGPECGRASAPRDPAVARQARDETCRHAARVHVVHQRQTDRTDERTHLRRTAGLVHGACDPQGPPGSGALTDGPRAA